MPVNQAPLTVSQDVLRQIVTALDGILAQVDVAHQAFLDTQNPDIGHPTAEMMAIQHLQDKYSTLYHPQTQASFGVLRTGLVQMQAAAKAIADLYDTAGRTEVASAAEVKAALAAGGQTAPGGTPTSATATNPFGTATTATNPYGTGVTA
jgi:hypothetical protein